MTTIPIDKELLEELVDLKVKSLDDEIEKILNLWDYDIPKKFLQDAKDGKIPEAENDAITLKHLIDQKEELLRLLKENNEKSDKLMSVAGGFKDDNEWDKILEEIYEERNKPARIL